MPAPTRLLALAALALATTGCPVKDGGGTPPCPDAGCQCATAADCDDGVFCNGAESCGAAGLCVPGIAPSDEDGSSCTVARCDEAARAIVHVPEDARCDDGDPCTHGRCQPGVGCAFEQLCGCQADLDCDDGNPCTAETCSPEGTCVYTDLEAACDDGLFCNGADRCSAGACTGHAGDPCAGGASCRDACDEVADHCLAPTGAACPDDGNPCTDDVCDGEGGCVHPNNAAPCDDGIRCNGADTCADGTCAVHAGDPCANGGECANACDEATGSCAVAAETPCSSDGNVCTDDRCDGLGACVHLSNTAPCDDGVFCNGADTCADGACAVHAGDPCAGGPECADRCDEAGVTCAVPGGEPCSTDDNACTDDQCDGAGRCDHLPNSDPCDDGLFCNGPDTCAAGGCNEHAGDPCLGNGTCNDVCNEGAEHCLAGPGASCADLTLEDCLTAACDGAGQCDQQYDVVGAGTQCGIGATGLCSAGGDCTAPTEFPYVPSNFDPATLSAPGVAVHLTCEATYDSSLNRFSSWCGPTPTSVLLTQPGGPEVRVLVMNSLNVAAGAKLTLVGSRPVILAVFGPAQIDGSLFAGAVGTTEGPGQSAGCGLGIGRDGTDGYSWGGLGTGAGGGGHGLAGASGSGTAAGGTEVGSPPLVPLSPGCRGGMGGDSTLGTPYPSSGGRGGGGGGAIQVSAAGELAVHGVIAAPGGGAQGGEGTQLSGTGGAAGGGGGAGGAILLEGAIVTIGTSARLTANGGGGGAGGSCCGLYGYANSGSDGSQTSETAAPGGWGIYYEQGSGGQGGTASARAAAGEPSRMNMYGSYGGAGGGGGEIGRIRLNAGTSCSVEAGALQSPLATSNGAGGCP